MSSFLLKTFLKSEVLQSSAKFLDASSNQQTSYIPPMIPLCFCHFQDFDEERAAMIEAAEAEALMRKAKLCQG